MPNKVFVSLFMGQGGFIFSSGIPLLAGKLQKQGATTIVYGYTEIDSALTNIAKYRKLEYKIVLVGYSLGWSTTSYIQTKVPVDLAIGIAASTLGENYQINHKNTAHSMLYAGFDFLSSGAMHDGIDEVIRVKSILPPIVEHLSLPFSEQVTSGIINKITELMKGN